MPSAVYTADFSPYLSLQLVFAVLDKRLLRSGRESHHSCDLSPHSEPGMQGELSRVPLAQVASEASAL